MTSRIIHVRKTVITFTCVECLNTHPIPLSAKLCCEGILPPINKELDDLVDKLVSDSYKDLTITPLRRSVMPRVKKNGAPKNTNPTAAKKTVAKRKSKKKTKVS